MGKTTNGSKPGNHGARWGDRPFAGRGATVETVVWISGVAPRCNSCCSKHWGQVLSCGQYVLEGGSTACARRRPNKAGDQRARWLCITAAAGNQPGGLDEQILDMVALERWRSDCKGGSTEELKGAKNLWCRGGAGRGTRAPAEHCRGARSQIAALPCERTGAMTWLRFALLKTSGMRSA